MLTDRAPAQKTEQEIKILSEEIRKLQEDTQLKIWNLAKSQAQRITSLRKLKLVSTIAQGCDGIVFKCSSEQIENLIALKILFNLGQATKQLRSTLTNENEILKSLPFHINIIPILNEFIDRPPNEYIDCFPPDLREFVVHTNGQIRAASCLIMPILESFDVFYQRHHLSLSVKQKYDFISDVVDGLHFLFNNNILHRDMKLNNLLINQNNRIIIADFGVACKVSPNKTVSLHPRDSLGW